MSYDKEAYETFKAVCVSLLIGAGYFCLLIAAFVIGWNLLP